MCIETEVNNHKDINPFKKIKQTNKKKTSHRKQLKERILKDLPLLVFVSNERNVDLAQILGEEKNKTDCPAKR